MVDKRASKVTAKPAFGEDAAERWARDLETLV